MGGEGITMPKIYPYLEGIFVNSQLVAIYSNKGYGLRWAARSDNVPQLKMGINMVVYALLHSGGKSEKKIDYELTPGIRVKRWNVEMSESHAQQR